MPPDPSTLIPRKQEQQTTTGQPPRARPCTRTEHNETWLGGHHSSWPDRPTALSREPVLTKPAIQPQKTANIKLQRPQTSKLQMTENMQPQKRVKEVSRLPLSSSSLTPQAHSSATEEQRLVHSSSVAVQTRLTPRHSKCIQMAIRYPQDTKSNLQRLCHQILHAQYPITTRMS